MHYRSGPSLGLTFEEAKAAGLQSAARGKAAYDAYVRAYNAMREGRRVAAPEPEPLRYKGTLTLRTFASIRIKAAQAIATAMTAPYGGQGFSYDEAARLIERIDKRGRIYYTDLGERQRSHQTSSKIPMKKEKR